MTRVAACACGQLTATCNGEPLRVSVCHCHSCQRRTGSVLAVQARFPAEAVEIRGAATEYVRTNQSGNRARFSFCPTCGSKVFWRLEGQDDQIAIAVGAFADPRFPAPLISMFDEEGHAWAVLPSEIERG